MDPVVINRFKIIFEEQVSKLSMRGSEILESFHIPKDDMLDDGDHTSTEIEQSMRMRLKSREALYLKKVTEALRRIQDGSFGLCTDCEEPIELKRLEARPTCTLCLDCKEEQERSEHSFAHGLEHKSLGKKLRVRLA